MIIILVLSAVCLMIYVFVKSVDLDKHIKEETRHD